MDEVGEPLLILIRIFSADVSLLANRCEARRHKSLLAVENKERKEKKTVPCLFTPFFSVVLVL